jgi:hypothetical protein
MRRALALLLPAVLALGCAGGAPPSAAPSPTASAVPSTSLSGSFLTVEAAGAAYSAVADPYNAAIDHAEDLYHARQSLKEHQQYWSLIAKADKAFIDGLKKIPFPPELADDAAVLIKADTAFQERARAVARARSLAEVISLSAAANDAADVVAEKAEDLRQGLGLGY